MVVETGGIDKRPRECSIRRVAGLVEDIIVRVAAEADAAALTALELALAEDGRGMVTVSNQVRTAEAERLRLIEIGSRGPDEALTVVLVAERAGDGAIVGTATLNQMRPAMCRHVGLLALGVHPDAQGRGVGKALMAELMARARALGLERLELYVRADNERARSLYASFGFELEGVRERFVRTPDGAYVDDCIMRRFV